MEFSGDELAGVVDLFGALSRSELCEALAELTYREGGEYEPDSFIDSISAAVDSYHLVAVDGDHVGLDGEVLVAGPGAFPMLPPGAGDIPHMLDIDPRPIDRETAGRAVLKRFRADAATVVDEGNPARVEQLLDVSYELESWTDVDLAEERELLDRVLG